MRKSSIFLLSTLLLVSCASIRRTEVREADIELKNIDRDLRRLLDCWFIQHNEVCFRKYLAPNSPILDNEDHFKNALNAVVYGNPGRPYKLNGKYLADQVYGGPDARVDPDFLKQITGISNLDTIEADGYWAMELTPQIVMEFSEHYKLKKLEGERAILVSLIVESDGVQGGIFFIFLVKKNYNWLLWNYAHVLD